jgi:hypothetical protein
VSLKKEKEKMNNFPIIDPYFYKWKNHLEVGMEKVRSVGFGLCASLVFFSRITVKLHENVYNH